jgi:hypothetical protein
LGGSEEFLKYRSKNVKNPEICPTLSKTKWELP